jgi:hypothetical protein
MNKRRLLKLAKLLRTDAKNKKGVQFDLTGWGILPPGAVKLDCNTTACAIGLAVLSGAFKKEGLFYDASAYIPVPRYNAQRGFAAVEEFFDLTEREALHLFHKDFYAISRRQGAVSERAVASRIERFCATKGASK